MSISRRNFLRGVGIGCSACAIGSFPPGALARNSPESIKGKTSLTPSLCEMCSYRCPIQAQVINNKTVFIQGNPNAPQQGTRVCARGGSGVSLVNDPHRIVKPMKRTGLAAAENGRLLVGNKLTKKLPKNDGNKSAAWSSGGRILFQIRFAFGSFISVGNGVWIAKHLYACVDMPCRKIDCRQSDDGRRFGYGYRQYPLYGLFWPQSL